MTKRLFLIPVLLLCMLFNGNVSTLVQVVVKSCNLGVVDDPSAFSLETDGDGDGDEKSHTVSPFQIALESARLASATSHPAVSPDRHDRIYALHNLRI